MALIERHRLGERLRARLDDTQWRVRYWWLDTESGARAHVGAFAVACLVLVYQLFKIALRVMLPPPVSTEPHEAVYWWVVQLIIAIIASIIAYVLRPKTPKQEEPKHEGPTVEDGLCIDDHFGEVWITEPHLMAWKKVGTEKIKAEGGKK